MNVTESAARCTSLCAQQGVVFLKTLYKLQTICGLNDLLFFMTVAPVPERFLFMDQAPAFGRFHALIS